VSGSFCPLRGPTRLRAEFPGGSVSYTLLSFEAGAPPTT
jgi:hypothetical protein